MLRHELIRLPECASTNTYAAGLGEMPAEDLLRVVVTDNQTSGRGQKGNHWEAEPGRNLTFSVVWKPAGVLPAEQFFISEAVALAVVDMLANHNIEAKVKWPNDIYAGDRKICGILIEHSLLGQEITRTIAGIGINVNQHQFLSDAPNPISMVQLTGKEYQLSDLLEEYIGCLKKRIARLATEDGRLGQHEEYKRTMWRMDGELHPFRDVATGNSYIGKILDVEPGGFLHIWAENAEKELRYAFKEVEFLSSKGF